MPTHKQDAATGIDRLVKSIHDNATDCRPKREGESWFGWWQAYQHDVLGEEVESYFEASRP